MTAQDFDLFFKKNLEFEHVVDINAKLYTVRKIACTFCVQSTKVLFRDSPSIVDLSLKDNRDTRDGEPGSALRPRWSHR